jgi:hypothetical protein
MSTINPASATPPRETTVADGVQQITRLTALQAGSTGYEQQVTAAARLIVAAYKTALDPAPSFPLPPPGSAPV